MTRKVFNSFESRSNSQEDWNLNLMIIGLKFSLLMVFRWWRRQESGNVFHSFCTSTLWCQSPQKNRRRRRKKATSRERFTDVLVQSVVGFVLSCRRVRISFKRRNEVSAHSNVVFRGLADEPIFFYKLVIVSV